MREEFGIVIRCFVLVNRWIVVEVLGWVIFRVDTVCWVIRSLFEIDVLKLYVVEIGCW